MAVKTNEVKGQEVAENAFLTSRIGAGEPGEGPGGLQSRRP